MGCNENPSDQRQNGADAESQKAERARLREQSIMRFALMKWRLIDSKIDEKAGRMTEEEALEQIKWRVQEKGYLRELLVGFGATNLKKPQGPA
ncbi:hypothetical protein AgCh_015837 [Apium graveolens]